MPRSDARGTFRPAATRLEGVTRPMPRRFAFSPARMVRLVVPLPLLLLLIGCGGVAAPPSPRPPAASPPPTKVSVTRSAAPAAPCANGRLTVGDLPAVDAAWAAGMEETTERARAWKTDARLVRLRVACQPLEMAFRWQGRYYSDGAQSFFLSDTKETEPAEVEPGSVPTLPLDRVSFRRLYLSLSRAGYPDDRALTAASGVTVRLNAPEDPFGPPGTPQDVVYHVAVDNQGTVQDLFVSAADWTIHPYEG